MTPSFDSTLIAPQSSSLPFSATTRDYPRRELRKGDTLYRAGDPADTVYRVEDGLLKLSVDLLNGKERIVNIVGPGDFVGAITPAHVTFQDSAEVLSPCVTVQVIPCDEVSGELKEQVFTAAGTHLSRMREALEDTELPVNARLARTFVRLGERFGQVADDETVRLTLPLTHDNFAAMVGAARETTTALLSEMRDGGLIRGTRGRYSFNQATLSDFAVEASLF